MTETSTIIIWVTLTFFAAGVVKGVIGMGLPTVAMGLLSLTMVPAAAAAALVVPSLVTNVWQYLAGPSTRAITRRLFVLLIAVCIGTFSGIAMLTTHAVAASAALGVMLAIYGALGLAAPRFTVPARAETYASPVVGLATGLITGATGIFVIPAVPYLNSLGFTKDELIQALGLSFTVSTVALGLALAWRGQYSLSAAGASLLAVVPAVAGMLLGQYVRGRLQADVFRRWFFISLIALGVYMAGRALT